MIIFARVAFYRGAPLYISRCRDSEHRYRIKGERYQFASTSTTRRYECWDPTGRKNKSETHNLFEGIALFSFDGGGRAGTTAIISQGRSLLSVLGSFAAFIAPSRTFSFELISLKALNGERSLNVWKYIRYYLISLLLTDIVFYIYDNML